MLTLPAMVDVKEGRVAVRLSLELLRALDDLRRNEADVPSRGEMVRRLIARAEAAAKAKKKAGP